MASRRGNKPPTGRLRGGVADQSRESRQQLQRVSGRENGNFSPISSNRSNKMNSSRSQLMDNSTVDWHAITPTKPKSQQEILSESDGGVSSYFICLCQYYLVMCCMLHIDMT